MDYFTYNTYAENIKAAEHFVSMAQEHSLGQRWNLVAAVAFSAFSIEAFINHVGKEQDDDWHEWDKIDRPNYEQKLKKLNVNLNGELKHHFAELFQLRDMIAHGRTISVSKKVRKPQNNLKCAMGNLSSEFESRTTLSKVNILVAEAKNVIAFINTETICLDKNKLWSIGNGSLRTS
ncbi:MAG: hypothetical protein KBT63_00860 [Porticoccaceae bacterium]|nr:hypothetical protein [Porticoccaceae bacterium]